MLNYAIRPFESDIDYNFIISSWLKSLRNDHTSLSNDLYYSRFKEEIERKINLANILVAVDREDPEHVYGYIAYNTIPCKIIHFIYIKLTYRNLGLCKALVNKAVQDPSINEIISTCDNRVFKSFANKDKRLKFNPYIIEEILK